MPIERSRRSMRKLSSVMDIANTIIGIAILACGVLILIDIKGNAGFFPIVFMLAAVMNGIMGMKYHMRREIARAIGLFLATAFLFVLSVLGIFGIWF